MIEVKINNGSICQQEIDAYIELGTRKYPNQTMTGIELTLDGEYVDIKYTFEPQPFQRIRRITGYLVGTLDRFNNAKRAEESQRVKHRV